LPETCDGSEPLSPWRAGATAGWFDTDIVFDDDVPMSAGTVMAQVAYQASPRLVLALAAGALVDGSIDGGDITTGPAGAASLAWLALLETERRPFALVALSIAASHAGAISDDGEEHGLTSGDGRLGLMVGKTFGAFTPYAAARVFGGPVLWTLAGDEVTGSDANHYTVGAGLTARAGRRLDLSLEVMPLGEKSATASASLAL
jgi:hypothetical protein